MTITPLRSIFVAASVFMALSASAADNTARRETPREALESKYPVTRYGEAANGVPHHVSGKLSVSVPANQTIQTTLAFFEKNKNAFTMTDPERELGIIRTETDRFGVQHLRFQQYHDGVKVYGSQMTSHFNRQGILKTVTGSYQPDIDVTVTPALSNQQAVSIARAARAELQDAEIEKGPELVVYRFNGVDHLAWNLYLRTLDGRKRREFFVDAITGEIIFHISRIMPTHAVGTGVSVLGFNRSHIDVDFNSGQYYLIDRSRRANFDPDGHGGQMADNAEIRTHATSVSDWPGPVGNSSDNIWDHISTEAPTVDAHVYAALVYDWMLRVLGRNSYDDAGSTMQSLVYFDGDFNNAFYNGSNVSYLYWSGSWRSLAGSPDVVAHEWAHGVTSHTSGLIYQKESGALNESFSDMMGAAFELAHDTLDAPDWFIGENGQINGNGFRSMADPTAFDDPDTYEGPNWISVTNCTPSDGNDWCGVHTNSGVGNKWFYLLSEGGSHNGVSVTGIGSEAAMKIAYQANRFYWTQSTTYPEAALSSVSAADDLDSTYLWSISVADAWTAVGIPTENPVLAFSADTTFGWVPMSINFTASSQKSVLNWKWDFGNGDSAFVQNPSHTYDAPGWYSVACAIDTGGGGRTLQRPGFIAALADSIYAQFVEGNPGGAVAVPIYARNTVPARSVIVPIEYAGSLALTFDSVTNTGLRSEVLSSVSLLNVDLFNKRLTARIQGPTSDVSMDPGTGPVLTAWFTVSSSVSTGDTNPIVVDGYSTRLPQFLTNIQDYTARTIEGGVTLCSTRGDFDGGGISISDLTFLVGYMFNSGPAPNPVSVADINCSGGPPDIADLTYLVAYMFGGGPAPCVCGA